MSQHHRMRTESTDSALDEDVRRVISQFVRRVRLETGTQRHSQRETLPLPENQGPLSVAEQASLRGVTHRSMRRVAGSAVSLSAPLSVVQILR